MLGDNIKRIRVNLGLSQIELANKMHVSRTTISSWETNRTEPTMGNIEQLSHIFRCKKSELLGENPLDQIFKDVEVKVVSKEDEIELLIEAAKNSDISDIQKATEYLKIMQYKPLIDSILKMKN